MVAGLICGFSSPPNDSMHGRGANWAMGRAGVAEEKRSTAECNPSWHKVQLYSWILPFLALFAHLSMRMLGPEPKDSTVRMVNITQ